MYGMYGIYAYISKSRLTLFSKPIYTRSLLLHYRTAQIQTDTHLLAIRTLFLNTLILLP